MDHQSVVLNLADDAKITDTVAPESGQFTMQRFTKMAGITRSLKPRLQPIDDAGRSRTVELGELLLRKRRDFNRPGQALS